MHAIKSFKELSTEERELLYSFYELHKGPIAPLGEEAVFAYMGMRDLDDGARFFSVWENGAPLATLGLVVAALARKHEIYLIGASATDTHESIAAFKSLIQLSNRKAYEGRMQGFKSRLGVGPRLSFLSPTVERLGYQLHESMLNLVLSGEGLRATLSASKSSMIPLFQEPMAAKNMPDYIRIHNQSFQTVPNGSETSTEELGEWLGSQHVTDWRGLLRDPEGKAIAFYELSQDGGTGWIDSIGVDPALHGCGYGNAVLQTCLDFLVSRDCTEIFLNVMDSNARAYGLYLKKGFVEKSIYNHWYQMKL